MRKHSYEEAKIQLLVFTDVHITVISETLDKVSVSKTFAQSRLVSVSTSSKFLGLEESRSGHISKFMVSKSLGLDIFCFLSLTDSISMYHIKYQYYFTSI
jgi:hypothetical protein